MVDIVAHPASNRMANCIAPTDHKLAGSSVLHVLAHRGGAHTSTDWYAEIARVVVDQVASIATVHIVVCSIFGYLLGGGLVGLRGVVLCECSAYSTGRQ